MGTKHGADELGLSSHGHAYQADTRPPPFSYTVVGLCLVLGMAIFGNPKQRKADKNILRGS